jgi:hypothetical protein
VHHRREKQTRGDGVDADAKLGELARKRQRHGCDGTLRCSIGGLTDLALKGCNGGDVNDYAALAVDELLCGCAVLSAVTERGCSERRAMVPR